MIDSFKLSRVLASADYKVPGRDSVATRPASDYGFLRFNDGGARLL